MAAPSYTTDLIDLIADSDTTAWGELVTMASGGAPDEADTESALQGTNSVSQITNTTSLFSMCRILGSPVTLNTGDVFLVWHCHSVATALLNYASGGLRLFIANTLTDWKGWSVGGNDVAPYPYGNWINNPIDPTIAYEYSNGTAPTGLTFYGVGSGGILSQVVARGQPHKVDIIRYGRAEARINGGDITNGYATFDGFATLNDATSARWGLIQTTTGGYLWKGLLTLGYSSMVDFRDSNKTIFVQDTRKVYLAFNKIEIRQTGSRVDWTGINFTCLSPSTTASKGALEVIDDADVNFDTCVFTDMNTFIFKANSTIQDSTFRRCDLVTQGSAVFTSCTFTNTTNSVKAILSDNPQNISNCTFVSSGTKHAIELTSACVGGTYTFTSNTFTGYASSNGSTGNEAIYNNSGGLVTLNIISSTSPSIRNGSGASTIVNNAVSLTIKVVDKNNSSVENAQTAIYRTSDDLQLMNGDTNASGVATSSFNYISDTAIYVRIRKSSTGTTKYYPASTVGTITSVGYSATITLIEDTTA